MSTQLRVEGLSKHYGRGGHTRAALEDVSFQAGAGEVVAVLGPNGAGKTTLLSIVAGAQRAHAGSVEPAAGQVGWAPQQPALYSKLTVAENLTLFARLEGLAEPRAAVARMLAQTGLEDRSGDLLESLSGGNRQRVNVALALIAEPRVLALDEPSASLDPIQRERLWEFVAGLIDSGTTVLFSTHSAAEAQRQADRVIVLRAGRVLLAATPGELLRAGGEQPGGDIERALVRVLDEPIARPAR